MRTFKTFTIATSILLVVGGIYGQSNWQSTDVAVSAKNEFGPDVAVGADGTAHIVFRKETVKVKNSHRYDIFYANTTSGTLSAPFQITNLGAWLQNSAIELDADVDVHVVFENNSNHTIMYLNNVGGSFSAPIDIGFDPTRSPRHPDLVIDATGVAHIVYWNLVNSVWRLFYATNPAGSFIVEDLGDFGLANGALQSSITERYGVVHIAFVSNISSGYWNVYYINNQGGSFASSPTVVINNGLSNRRPTISVDSQGAVHIVYLDGNGLRHAHNNGGTFVHESINSESVGGTAHALGPADEIGVVTTYDVSGLKFITNLGGSWTSEDITDAGSGDVARCCYGNGGIGIDGDGYVHVVSRIDRGNAGKTNIDIRYHTNNPNFGGGSGPPNEGNECFIQDIVMSLSFKDKGKPSNRGWTATATVLIKDDQGNSVSEAAVSGHWTGLTSDTDNGTTGSDGRVSLDSDRINATGTFTFTVDNVSHPSLTYNPALNVLDSNSISNLSKSIADATIINSMPSEFQLLPNYPNPFNPETTISYQLPEQSQVKLEIYNFSGQLVRSLFVGPQNQGSHSLVWDGMDDAGQNVASGVYLIQMTAGTFAASQKISLIR